MVQVDPTPGPSPGAVGLRSRPLCLHQPAHLDAGGAGADGVGVGGGVPVTSSPVCPGSPSQSGPRSTRTSPSPWPPPRASSWPASGQRPTRWATSKGGLVSSGMAGKTPSAFSGLAPPPHPAPPPHVCTWLPFQGALRPREEKPNVGAGPGALPGDLTHANCFGLAMPGMDRGPRADHTHNWPQWGSPTLPSRWPAWPSQL